MSVNEILREICRAGEKYHAEAIILFGSRAKGTATERSDIDIAALVPDGLFDKFADEVQDIPTLLKIDVVDLDSCRNELLKEDIAEYGRKIYPKI